MIDERLYDFATETDRRHLDALKEFGSVRAAEAALGLGNDTMGKAIRRVKARAASQGYAPGHFVDGVAAGFRMGKVTVQRGPNGVERVWERQSPDQERQRELLDATLEALAADIVPLPPIAAPAYHDARLLTVLPLGDPHFGMHSWAAETGDNFDLGIAEHLTFAAVDRLCERTPSSDTAMLLNLGDYFHADNGTNRTPNSGARLDVDGRFAKIATVGVRAMVRCIERLLEKHQHVIVRNNPGNHDPHQAAMLSICLAARFHDNPRVSIDDSPSSFFYKLWGKTLIGSTHGDGAKLTELPLIMAADVPQLWADAIWRVWHCGHFHHNQRLTEKDLVGCTVETHRTLAAGDAWHRHQGYRAYRDLKAIVYDLEYGEVMRLRCGVEELEMAA